MLKTIQQHVLNDWERLFPSLKRPDAIHTLQVSQSHRKDFSKGRIVHLLFADGADQPFAAARFCRDRAYEGSLEREASIRRGLTSGGLMECVPAVLDMPVLGGKLVMIETAAEGVPMSVTVEGGCCRLGMDALRELAGRHFGIAAKFMGALKAGTRPEAGTDDGKPWDEIGPVITKYVNLFGVSGVEEYSAFGLGQAAARLLGDGSGACLVHMDFTPSNMMLAEDGGLKVIDWEFSRRGRLGFLDPMRFIYYYYSILKGQGVFGKDAFFETFLKPGNWFTSLAMGFAAEVEGPALKDEDAFRTLLGVFLIYEASLQTEVAGGVDVINTKPERDMVNLISGVHSLRERELLKDEVKAMKADIEGLNLANTALQAERHMLKMEITNMLNSKSWRMTYPVRWVSGILKGIEPK